MAAISSPYGFRPVNRIDGLPYAGVTRQIKIASGYASNIFNGSLVSIVNTGTIAMVTNIGTAFPVGTIGVFLGCQYTDPNFGLTFKQYWPSGTLANDAVGFVVDDPNVLFQVQADNTMAQSTLGENVILSVVQSTTSGSTNTGNSNTAVNATSATTNTYAFRVVDFVNSPTSRVGDAYTDILVKFNPVAHSYTNVLGV